MKLKVEIELRLESEDKLPSNLHRQVRRVVGYMKREDDRLEWLTYSLHATGTGEQIGTVTVKKI